jgi:hypothetical protein
LYASVCVFDEAERDAKNTSDVLVREAGNKKLLQNCPGFCSFMAKQ